MASRKHAKKRRYLYLLAVWIRHGDEKRLHYKRTTLQICMLLTTENVRMLTTELDAT